MDMIKVLQKDGLSEDMAKSGESEVQKMVDDYNSKIDNAINVKEQEITTI
jgi:ribosome recycling factor